MVLEFGVVLALAQQCAPSVAPETLLSVVRTESAFNPNAIGVNTGRRLRRQPYTRAEAVQMATELQRAGANFDLGLGQINSSNFGWLGLTVSTALDPCRNLAAAARVLETNYGTARRSTSDPQAALRVALSMYNTGSPTRGFRNGYVTKVAGSARHVVPAISEPAALTSPPPDLTVVAAVTETNVPEAGPVMLAAEKPAPPRWDVFARRAEPVDVFDRGSAAPAPGEPEAAKQTELSQ